MFPGGMNMGKFGKQFEDMQKKLQRLETELKERVVEATSGGGMVKVKVNGTEEVVDVKIEKDVINPDDKGMLEDLVLAAVNEGVKKAKKLRETELAKITGMVLPGLM
jgi:DNA-binding YbaB/EbfC family protein